MLQQTKRKNKFRAYLPPFRDSCQPVAWVSGGELHGFAYHIWSQLFTPKLQDSDAKFDGENRPVSNEHSQLVRGYRLPMYFGEVILQGQLSDTLGDKNEGHEQIL